MEKNKTIDGLAFRREKKQATAKKNIDGTSAIKRGVRNTKAVDADFTRSRKAEPVIDKAVIEENSTFESEVMPLELINSVVDEPTIVEEIEVEEEPVDTEPTNGIDLLAEVSDTDDFLKPVETFDFDAKSGQLKESDEPIMKKHNEKIDRKAEKRAEKRDAKQLKKTNKSGKKHRGLTIFLIVILSLLILACVVLFIGETYIRKMTGGKSGIFDGIGVLMSDTYDPLLEDANGRTNILAFGTSGYNMAGDEGDGQHDGAQLTDSILVISIDQNAGDIVMLSLPRDLKASATCTSTGKINEIYWCNNLDGEHEEAGATALMNEVGDILGIDFQYYAHINWGSLVSIVDILDGITVTLDEDIADYYYTGAVFSAGVPYTINGEQALGLARARHGTAGGDFSRGNSQQKILIGIKDRIYEKNLSVVDMANLALTLGDNLRTNFSAGEIKTTAHLTFEFDFDKMRQVTLVDYNTGVYYFTDAMINDISYVIPAEGVGNYTNIRTFVAEQFKTPEPEPEPIEEPIKESSETSSEELNQ